MPEMSPNLHSTLQSSVCKALGRLLGVTEELREFDHLRTQVITKQKSTYYNLILSQFMLFHYFLFSRILCIYFVSFHIYINI